MATIDTENSSTELGLAFAPPGLEQIPGSTILTRLNYYDGKFLRADDLRLEQEYLRRLVELDARAGGSGVVYGFDVSLGTGDALTIGGGLAFDPSGRVLYMPAAVTVGLQDVIDATRRATEAAQQASAGSSSFAICPPGEEQPKPPGPAGAEFYVITIAHAEEACGEEDVFGTLCDDGCATATDRAYLVEGVVVRATPFLPRTAFADPASVRLTQAHVRSQLVSAYFEDERGFVPCMISKAGLASGVWCNGAAAPSGWEVPLAVVGLLSSSRFVDEWVVRRERMEPPPRRYWAGRMCMRPWDVFLAQVLQFQCQLPAVLSGGGDPTSTDPCAPHTEVIRQVSSYVAKLARVVAEPAPQPALPAPLSLETIATLQRRLADVLAAAALPSQRILIDGGLVELPPAGYLPVTPGTTPPVDEQVRRLMGPGVDLRFCVTTPDYVPRAFESAQHMERISLVRGLDDPALKPKVDVLVPLGTIGAAAATQARGWDATITLEPALVAALTRTGESTHSLTHLATAPALVLQGVGRSARIDGGGGECAFAGPRSDGPDIADVPPIGAYGSVTCDRDPVTLASGDTFAVHGEAALVAATEKPFGDTATGTATFTVASRSSAGGAVEVKANGTLSASATSLTAGSGSVGPVAVSITIRFTASGCEVQIADEQGVERASLKASWSGSPLTAQAALQSVDEQKEQTQPVAEAEATEDAGVFSSSNALHQQAVTALQTIATVLHDNRYTGAVADHLFDPKGAASNGSGGITATLDWVLFHRRRELDCTMVVASPTPTKTQTYRVFLANPQASMVAAVAKAVMSDDANLVQRYKVHEVGLVEFAEDGASLSTSAADVLTAWKAANPGAVIAYAAVAVETGAAAQDTLLEQRVSAYQAAVQQVSTPRQGEPVEVRRPTLTHLTGGPDGQIIFVTTALQVGYEVLAAFTDAGANALAALAAGGDVDAFRSDAQSHALGTITFDAGTAKVGKSSLKTLADTMNNQTEVRRVSVFPRPGEKTTEDVRPQVDAILQTVGGVLGEDDVNVLDSKANTPPAGISLTCVLEVIG